MSNAIGKREDVLKTHGVKSPNRAAFQEAANAKRQVLKGLLIEMVTPAGEVQHV